MLTVHTTRRMLEGLGALARHALRHLEGFLWEWTTNGQKRHRIPHRYRQGAPARSDHY